MEKYQLAERIDKVHKMWLIDYHRNESRLNFYYQPTMWCRSKVNSLNIQEHGKWESAGFSSIHQRWHISFPCDFGVFFYCPLASHWLIFTNFTVCIQWPDQINHQTHAPLLMVNIQEAAFNFDPLLYAWLLFSPSTIPHANISKIPTRPSFIPNDTNAQR